jgi:hypothetical protein
MANALHRSSDVANFDTYPSDPQLADSPNRLLPEETKASPLEEYGAQLGSAAGQAVVALRRAQQKVKDMATQRRAKVTDIASARMQQVTARLDDARQEASARAEELGRGARERIYEWRRQLRNSLYRSRLRAREIQNDYPVHVILGAGLAGFVIGAGLRIWRSYRA